MTPIEVVEDAQKKVSNVIALLASADSRRMEFPTQVAQKEEEERGVSFGLRDAAIHKHYQAEEVVNKGSKEGQGSHGGVEAGEVSHVKSYARRYARRCNRVGAGTGRRRKEGAGGAHRHQQGARAERALDQ